MRWDSTAAAGVAGYCSIGVGLAGTVCVPIWDFPATGVSNAGVQEFFQRHRTAAQIEIVLDAVVAALWLVFGCGVWQRLRTQRSMVPGCFLGGVVAMSTLLLSGFTVFAVMLYHLPSDAELLRVLYDLGFGLLAMSGIPAAIALAAFAVGAHHSPATPRVVVALAWATSAVHVLFLATFLVPRGALSLEGPMIAVAPIMLFVWIGNTSRWLMRTRAELADDVFR